MELVSEGKHPRIMSHHPTLSGGQMARAHPRSDRRPGAFRAAPTLAVSLVVGVLVAAMLPGWAAAAPGVTRAAPAVTGPADEPGGGETGGEPGDETPTTEPTPTEPEVTDPAPPTVAPPTETTPPLPTEPAPTQTVPTTPTGPAPTTAPPVEPAPTLPPPGPPGPGQPGQAQLGVQVSTGDLTLTKAYWNAATTVADLRITVANTGRVSQQVQLGYRLPTGLTDGGTPGCVAVGGGEHRCGAWTTASGARFSALIRVRVDRDAWQRMPLSGTVRVSATGPAGSTPVGDD
jgi:hypothetical protein